MAPIELQAISSDEDVLAAVLDASSDAIVLQDTSGRIVRWNARALDLFGLTDEGIEGRNWIDPRWRFIGLDGSDLPGDLHPSSLVLHSGEAIDGFEMGVHRPNGERRWLSVKSRPLRDGEGELLGVLTDFRDLTDEVDKASSSHADAERFPYRIRPLAGRPADRRRQGPIPGRQPGVVRVVRDTARRDHRTGLDHPLRARRVGTAVAAVAPAVRHGDRAGRDRVPPVGRPDPAWVDAGV